MPLTQSNIVSFYQGCEYWPVRGMSLRPRELHIPNVLAEHLEENPDTSLFDIITSKELKIIIDPDSVDTIAPILLHESLFHFYKAFYNYLAVRALYFNGLKHWIKVTLYYAQFYLARSITVLCGKQQYFVDKEQPFFSPVIASLLTKNGKQVPNSYRIKLDLDLATKIGSIVVDREGVSSHRDVWSDYQQIAVDSFGLRKLAFDGQISKQMSRFDTPWHRLVQERNEENYSFKGYWSLDFNTPTETFRGFYDNIVTNLKNSADTIYDFESSVVLLAFSTQYRLYTKLKVPNLPIEREKLLHMIEVYLPDSKAKEHLSILCKEGFPTENLYSTDGEIFYDEQDRAL